MNAVTANLGGRRARPPARLLRAVMAALAVIIIAIVVDGRCVRGDETEPGTTSESLSGWEYHERITIPGKGDSPWIDVVLTPSVFDAARYDLGDLRLYDASGREVPYALRVRRKEDRKDTFKAREFNRVEGPDNSTELSLDVGEQVGEHNEVEVALPGSDFRRRAELEGSDDGQKWLKLVEKNLIRFQAGEKVVEDRRLSYPPCRFRYLRIRVFPDPQVDKKPVEIGAVTVGRRVEVPGETLTLPGKLGEREPVRADGAPGSAWMVDLGADNVPCDRIEVEIGDAEFVRDYYVEAGGPPDSDEPFRRVASGEWRRRAGEPKVPMKAEFTEIRAARLKLVVTDHRNPPLDVRSVKYSAPARQVVFARLDGPDGDVRLYFGNPKAEAPHYDFAGNLPQRLEPAPVRATLGPRLQNPGYVPEPLPFTERWPWAIYVVLGAVSLVLAGIIFSVARTAIEVHDAEQQG